MTACLICSIILKSIAVKLYILISVNSQCTSQSSVYKALLIRSFSYDLYSVTHLVMKSKTLLLSLLCSVLESCYTSITRPVFGDSSVKELSILVDINAYNHHMREVDIENQYWAGFTTLQHQNQCYWKLLFYWLLDIALVNSYLLYKTYQRLVIENSKHYHHDHQQFQEDLAKILMTYCETLEHNQIYRSKRVYCVYCQKN
jgi:hypothetical protein